MKKSLWLLPLRQHGDIHIWTKNWIDGATRIYVWRHLSSFFGSSISSFSAVSQAIWLVVVVSVVVVAVVSVVVIVVVSVVVVVVAVVLIFHVFLP